MTELLQYPQKWPSTNKKMCFFHIHLLADFYLANGIKIPALFGLVFTEILSLKMPPPLLSFICRIYSPKAVPVETDHSSSHQKNRDHHPYHNQLPATCVNHLMKLFF